MTTDLDRPGEIDDLYLARGEEVSPHRPILQGDVFADVEIGGLETKGTIIVVSHPCTMRTGATLKSRLQAARVRADGPPIRLEDWADGHFRAMPLPGLKGNSTNASAVLSEIGLVQASDLKLDHRIACLSEAGIYLLQQRLVFCLTRVRIGLDTLAEASRHVLDEVDLLEEWVERQVPDTAATGFSEALVKASEEFDVFLSEPAAAPLRSKLELPRECAGVRREVRAELDRRNR